MDPDRRPPVEFADSWQLTAAQLNSLYDEVLAPSFPADELIPREDLLPRLRQADGVCCRVAVDPDGTVVAGILADVFPSRRVLLLSYLAVRAGLRDRGLGTELAREAVPLWIARHRPVIALAEVEDPRHHLGTRYGDASARFRLYERIGGRVLPLPYLQPALAAGTKRVRNLLLTVFYTTAEALRDPSHVDSELLTGFLTEYFESCEGAVAADPEFAALIAACRRPDGVPLLAPSAYLAG
jgi:hypothetical protein